MKRFVSLTFFAVFSMYIVFHTINGERGLYALFVQSHRKETLHTELASLRAERALMEKRVHAMRDDSLDPDMLDEQARRLLGMSHPDEIMLGMQRP